MNMTVSEPSQLQLGVDDFFKQAVDKGIAPGFQYVVFDKDRFLAKGAVGDATVANKEAGTPAKEMTEDTICWVASCSKFGIALVVLHILEKGLSKDHFTLADLDNPDALVRYLPEFKLDSTSNVSKILKGFGPLDTTTNKLQPNVINKSKIPTIRQMLAHTAGLAYYWSETGQMNQWYNPSSGDPQATLPFMTGKISDFDNPCVREAGLEYEYGPSLDWMALWSVRATGINLRRLYSEILFGPLGMKDTCDVYLDEEKYGHLKAGMHVSTPQGFVQIPFGIWSCEDDPPEGHNHFGSAAVWASHIDYARLWQAALRKDEKILSKETWDLAFGDQATPYEVEMPKQLIPGGRPDLIAACEEFSIGGKEVPTLLSTLLTTSPCKSGKPPGVQSWVGLGNAYYSFDVKNNRGFFFGTQVLPCGGVFHELRDEFERKFFSGEFERGDHVNGTS